MAHALEPRYSYYKALQKIDSVDLVKQAIFRERAQAILATPTIPLKFRQILADRLNQVNQQLVMRTVTSEDSY